MDLTFSVEHDYKDIKDKEDKPIFLIVAFSKWHNTGCFLHMILNKYIYYWVPREMIWWLLEKN